MKTLKWFLAITCAFTLLSCNHIDNPTLYKESEHDIRKKNADSHNDSTDSTDVTATQKDWETVTDTIEAGEVPQD